MRPWENYSNEKMGPWVLEFPVDLDTVERGLGIGGKTDSHAENRGGKSAPEHRHGEPLSHGALEANGGKASFKDQRKAGEQYSQSCFPGDRILMGGRWY